MRNDFLYDKLLEHGFFVEFLHDAWKKTNDYTARKKGIVFSWRTFGSGDNKVAVDMIASCKDLEQEHEFVEILNDIYTTYNKETV